jgi:predicted phosphate transport protein (TIGR00153 family)
MESLVEHYDKIVEGVDLIEESMACYIGDGPCRQFEDLFEEVARLEDEADKIKRRIRNHLPRGLFMPVDKTIFLNYTRNQDNILDDGQEALTWLVMRRVDIPKPFRGAFIGLVEEVAETVHLLRPALLATVALVLGQSYDRTGTKSAYRVVRDQHKKVWRDHMDLLSQLLNSGADFRDVFQLVRLVECLEGMSHNTEGCADRLRSMIAR